MEILKTGIQNFDEILSGGFPLNSLNFIAGPPGTGKTILIHQLLFNNPGKALYITTLSEPMSKVIKFMQSFDFFDSSVFNEKIVYRDIGSMLRTTSIEEAYENITELLKEIQPDILCIDSFKAIRDLAQSEYEFRRFCYDLAVQLAVLNCTTFYVGEYQIEDITKSPEFAIADGIIYLYTDDLGGDQQRQLKIVKMRGREISITPFPFVITSKGIKILAPILELKKKKMKPRDSKQITEIGIKGLDAILKGGAPKGSSILLSGVAGTGKTTLGIQFICKGTERNEKGLFISTEEDSDRIKEIALGYGCNFDKLEKEKMIKIIYFPQDEMNVNRNLDDIKNTMEKFKPDRVVMDSFSVFLHKVKETSSQRIKAFELSSIVKNYGSTSLYISDIQAGENTISRFGVEETVMDGVIVLSTTMKDTKRKRFLEVYKLRASDYVYGKYRMEITSKGIEVHYLVPSIIEKTPQPLEFPALRQILRNCRFGSTWLVRGEQGSGKSTLANQFTIEGLRRKESVLYLSFDASIYDVKRNMESWQILVEPYIESGYLKLIEALPTSEAFLDLTDSDRIIYAIDAILDTMPKPCRVVMDSLTPITVHVSPENFVRFIDSKNRLLRRVDVVLFDTILTRTLSENIIYSSLNSYDIVLDLKTPDWGEMERAGHRLKAIEVRKARGAIAETQMYPYIIRKGEGLVIQKEEIGISERR